MTSTHYDSLTGYLQIHRGTFTLTMCNSSQPYSTIVLVGVLCIHFTIFFRFTFTAVPASLTVVRKRTDIPGTEVPGNIRSRERKFLGTFVPRSESSRELSFLGAEVPTGTFAPRSENTGERKVLIPASHWELAILGCQNSVTPEPID